MSGQHAELSPSSAGRWMRCLGSVEASRGLPDEGSAHAQEGTDAHTLAERCLTSGNAAAMWIGDTLPEGTVVDGDFAQYVQAYVDYVYARAGEEGYVHVEQRLDISWMTGEANAKGTSDAVILLPRHLLVVDLKFGRGVQVDAQENEQLLMYAASAMREFEVSDGPFDTVEVVIHQPRLNHVSSWTLTREQLKVFTDWVGVVASTLHNAVIPLERTPGEKQCRWCRAKATCPAVAASVAETTGAMFDDLTAQPAVTQPSTFEDAKLQRAMSHVDLIEGWCKSVRGEMERRLTQGGDPAHLGYKLVQGKRGSRTWTDADAAEKALKAMRVKVEHMYDLKLISPTAAEKLIKVKVIGPRQWEKLQPLIGQSDGKLSVAPNTDPRPAALLGASQDDFELLPDLSGADLA